MVTRALLDLLLIKAHVRKLRRYISIPRLDFKMFLNKIEYVMFLISVCIFPPPLSPVPPTDRKVSLRRQLCRERVGVKSAWFALMRLQVVTMESSPAGAARSSSKEQLKVRVHSSAHVGWL